MSRRTVLTQLATCAQTLRLSLRGGSQRSKIMARWQVYDKSLPLQEWLNLHKPSETTKLDAAWLYVENSIHPKPYVAADLNGAMMDWHRLLAERKPTAEDIDELAKKYNVLVGKWLVFAESPQIDAIWNSIATATFEGKLGPSSKVSTKSFDDPSHVICVYTNNFLEFSEVQKVRETLRELGLRDSLYYKPDIYTYFNIYDKNTWGLHASRYYM